MTVQTTQIRGILQGDIVIRTAIAAALADMRANPWLLDYVFANVTQDDLTKQEYGAASLQSGKDWFLKTNIQVATTPIIDEGMFPCISVNLKESSEVVSELTLGDVNSTVSETNDATWPTLAVFTPASYVPSTGYVTLEEALDVPVFPGQSLVDYSGRAHEILEVISDTVIKITPDTVADFRNAALKPIAPAWSAAIESASYRETYAIGLHVGSEPVFLTWLHSVVVFALLRYKELLFEARGFERSGFSSGPVTYDPLGESELAFVRYINMTGYVRHYWPKAISRRVDGVLFDKLSVDGAGHLPLPEDVDTALWVGDLDVDDEDDE